MSPAYANDIFSDGLGGRGNRSPSAIIHVQEGGTRDVASHPPRQPQKIASVSTDELVNVTMVDLTIDTPRKKDRVMSDKSVDTKELRRDKKRPRIHSRGSSESSDARVEIGKTERGLAPKSSELSLSSQYSYWEGDDNWDTILADLEQDEQEVENLTQPFADNLAMSISGRSDSDSSRTSSTSTEATSVYSDAPIHSTGGKSANNPVSASSANVRRQEGTDTKGKAIGPAKCESTSSSTKLQVFTTIGSVPKCFKDQKRIVESPTELRSVVRYEKIAAPAVKPLTKLKQPADDKAGQSINVIDLTVSDEEEPVPGASKAPGKKLPTDKSTLSRRSHVQEKERSAHSTPKVIKPLYTAEPFVEPPIGRSDKTEIGSQQFVIAHDSRVQALFDKHEIARGVQYEIVRGITHGWWDWEYIVEGKVKQLKGSNSDKAPTVANIMDSGRQGDSLNPSVISSNATSFAELDREHEARLEGRGRGLGLMGAWHGVAKWYGGCVQQIARLSEFNDKTGAMKITLDRLEKGRSNRLTRFLGSVSVLQIRIKKELVTRHGEALIKALARRFILCGRIFLPFHAKEDKVYLVEINEDFERSPVASLGDGARLSWDNFIKWHNPLDLNAKQPMSKWSTRWALTLSTSVPVLEFAPENIFFIRDEYAEGQPPSTETMMTDGCGFINLAALGSIAVTLSYPFPVVVQGRLAGFKGIWVLHPDPCHRVQDEPPMIWIRDSQYKVQLGDPRDWDKSHLIFDLVRLPRITIPSSLYMQTIVNMSFNGVEDAVFNDLLEDGLRREIDPLVAWSGPNSRALLAKAIENAGGLMGSRLRRLTGSEARVYNYIRDDDKEVDLDGTDGDVEKSLIERQGEGSCPVSLYESTRELLQAGFHPVTSSIVREKMKHIVKLVMDQYMEQYHISVPRSAEAFIVPDPYGVLEEGQIYFRSSKPIGDVATTADPYSFTGPVLVTRNPTRVASDVQKVTAVTHDKLLSYMDVIVFPTKGKRSLASYLGGGDYDGDTVTIIADPTVVNGFNHPITVREPPDLRDNFEREVEEVTAFMARTSKLPTFSKERELCMKLLLGLSDSKVGLYSQFHDNASYSKGYDHPEAVRLAYMFTTCLDSSKTGLRVKPDVFRRDSLKWNRPRPSCMRKALETEQNLNSGHNTFPLTRDKTLGRFVLESLKNRASELKDKVLIHYDKLCKEAAGKKDAVLAEPYLEAEICVRRFKAEYKLCEFWDHFLIMKEEISTICDDYITKLGEHHKSSPKKKSKAGRTKLSNDTASSPTNSRKAITGELIARFNNVKPKNFLFTESQFNEIKASYAYVYAFDERWDGTLAREFPFCVAHDVLCAIKARKEGPISMTRDTADFSTFSSKLLQVSVRD